MSPIKQEKNEEENNIVSGKADEGRRGQISQVLLTEIKRNENWLSTIWIFQLPGDFGGSVKT